MLGWRMLLGIAIITALAGLCWLDHHGTIPGLWLLPVAIVLTVLATGEMLKLVRAAGMRPQGWIVYSGNLILVVIGWIAPLVMGFVAEAPSNPAGDWIAATGGVSWLALAFSLVVLAIFVAEIYQYEKPGGAIANLAAAVLSAAYTGLLMGLLVELRMVWGIGGLASLVIVVKSGDIGAYTVGRIIWRHKLVPLLSPGKTIEGVVGALAAGCLGSWATFRWIVPTSMPHFPERTHWWAWMTFGLVVATAGIVGDLGESLLKRDVQKKDSSTWLPGFGGILDIMDSILLASPIAYLFWVIRLL